MPTELATFGLNVAGTADCAIEIARSARGHGLRVRVRVPSSPPGIAVTLTKVASALEHVASDGSSANGFTIPGGGADTLMLGPNESLWAAGTIAGGSVCVALSEIHDNGPG